MKIAMSAPINTPKLLTRESLLRANSELIGQLQERLKAKRFRPQEGDGIKLAYLRLYLQALQAYNAMLKDFELDEIQKRLEALENSQNEKVGASKAHNSALGA